MCIPFRSEIRRWWRRWCEGYSLSTAAQTFHISPPSLRRKWQPHPKRLTTCVTISGTVAPGDMTARNVYKPSESEPKCPETLVNKQKTTSPGLRDQEAAGSNPVTPMRKPSKSLRFGGFSFFAFSGLTTGFTIDRAGFGETVFLVCSAPDFLRGGRGGGAEALRHGFSLSSAGENLPIVRDN